MFKTYSSSSSLVITSRWFATSRLRAPVSVRLVYCVWFAGVATLIGSHLTREPTSSPVLTKWSKWELMLSTNFGSPLQIVTKVGSQILATKFGFVLDCSVCPSVRLPILPSHIQCPICGSLPKSWITFVCGMRGQGVAYHLLGIRSKVKVTQVIRIFVVKMGVIIVVVITNIQLLVDLSHYPGHVIHHAQ